jgi:hypothetical protein
MLEILVRRIYNEKRSQPWAYCDTPPQRANRVRSELASSCLPD